MVQIGELSLTAAVSLVTLLTLQSLAPRLGLIDEPGERRKSHRHAVPPVGGLAVFFAMLVALIGLSESQLFAIAITVFVTYLLLLAEPGIFTGT